MKSSLLETLKQIALKGGYINSVSFSSKELGKIMEISQQSASKRILELLKMGMIIRELGVRKQVIRIAPLGIENLRKEYLLYQKLFESIRYIVIHGTVVTGFGEGQYYLNYKEYSSQFKRRLHFQPYQGTLNLKITGQDLTHIQSLRNMDGITIKGFKKYGRTFGDVKCFSCKINNFDCAVIFPLRSHYDDVVEIISKYHLRRTLNLENGDKVEVIIEI